MGPAKQGWRAADVIPSGETTVFRFDWDGQMTRDVRVTIHYTDLPRSTRAFQFRRMEVTERDRNGRL
jgi:hypothetical protein